MNDNNQPNNGVNVLHILFTAIILIGIGLFIGKLQHDRSLEEYAAKFKTYQDSVVTPAMKANEILLKKTDSAIVVANEAGKKADALTDTLNAKKRVVLTLHAINKQLEDSIRARSPKECADVFAVVDSKNKEIVQDSTIIANQERRDTLRLTQISGLSLAILQQRDVIEKQHDIIINIPAPASSSKFLGLFNLKIDGKTGYALGVVSTLVAVIAVRH